MDKLTKTLSVLVILSMMTAIYYLVKNDTSRAVLWITLAIFNSNGVYYSLLRNKISQLKDEE